MQHNHTHLFKISGVIAMLLGVTFDTSADMVHIDNNMLQMDVANVMAARLEDNVGTTTDVPFGSETIPVTVLTSPRVLCAEGTYLEKCGTNKIGFNWLKSICFNNDTTNCSRNYYGAASILNSGLYKKMREVFSSTDDISITYKDTDNNISNASHDDVVDDRKKILNFYCNPFTDTITCKACPNNAKVEPSIVYTLNISSSISNTVNVWSWDIRTFADCYMDEFEDSTGTYVYQDGISTDAEKCYYGQSGVIRIFQGTDVVEAVQSMQATYSNEAIAH